MHWSDAINWVWKHPLRERVIPGWDKWQVSTYLMARLEAEEADESSIKILWDHKAGIIGVLVCNINAAKREIFVDFLLISSPKAMSALIYFWNAEYSHYTVVAQRQRGKRRIYHLRNFSRYLNHEYVASSC